MKIIGFIEDDEIIEKILRHLGLWETRSHGNRIPARCLRSICKGSSGGHISDTEKNPGLAVTLLSAHLKEGLEIIRNTYFKTPH